MKVKRFIGPRSLIAAVAQARTILRGFWFLVRTHLLLSLMLLGVAFALGSCLWPYDRALLERIHFWSPGAEATARSISWYLSTWGDYPTYNVPLALLLWLYGVWSNSRTWRRLGIICFLGATLAGGFDDCFRLTLGRPRPDAGLPDHFYGIGFVLEGKYQSFPSGHAAAVFGTSAALLMVDLPLGILTTVFALAVVWARMELYRHYPSDVFVGSGIGLFFGTMVGLGAGVRRSMNSNNRSS